MILASSTASQPDAAAPDADSPAPGEGPALAEVLDPQEADVPATANAYKHFFGCV